MNESFIYTISSEESISKNTDPFDFLLNVGGFNSDKENYKFELMSFVMDTDLSSLSDYMVISLQNLASNGVCSQSIVGSSSILIPIITDVATSGVVFGRYISNGLNIFFNVNNCRMKRIFNIALLSSDLTPYQGAPDEVADWLITFKVTPIN